MSFHLTDGSKARLGWCKSFNQMEDCSGASRVCHHIVRFWPARETESPEKRPPGQRNKGAACGGRTMEVCDSIAPRWAGQVSKKKKGGLWRAHRIVSPKPAIRL